jgi:hypothetical protein
MKQLFIGAVVLGSLLLAAPAVSKADDSEGEANSAYGASCAAAIGTVHAFDCRDGEIIPVSVNGKVVRDQIPAECDRPAQSGENAEWPAGRCVPFSRLLRLRDGDVQAVAICRRKRLRPVDAPLFEEIDLILHSKRSGSTCWFVATRPEDPPHQSSRTAPFDAAAVPTPTDIQTAAISFWDPPVHVAAQRCAECHDSSPYMFSAYVGQVWGSMPTDPFGRYTNDVGKDFVSWPKPASMTPAGNTCTGCHRIGVTKTCSKTFLEGTGFIPLQFHTPGSNAAFGYSMPLLHGLSQQAWTGLHGTSVTAIERCCGLAGQAGGAPEECSIAPIQPGGR